MSSQREYRSLSEAISDINCGRAVIDKMRPVSGGDINDACICLLSDGSRLFMKSNSRDNIDFFRKESAGLLAIKQAGTINTPEVLGFGTEGDSSFLLLSCIDSKQPSPSFHENFGRNLALLHSSPADSYVISGKFGFYHDNYIGAGYQINHAKDSWLEFFRECRLKPQFDRAERFFDPPMIKKCASLLDRLDSYLIEPAFPSLLHGDLWSGNYMTGPDGEAWLIDPAVYVGHYEADIAMTELFGGFSDAFYSAYHEVRPEISGYKDRKDLYNLYHLLNHLNLFGGSYFYSVKRTIERYS